VIAASLFAMMMGPTGCTQGKSPAPPQASPRGSEVASPDASTRSSDDKVLSFDFDDLGAIGYPGLGSGALGLVNRGSEPLTVRVASASGGTLRTVRDRDGGYAARFPAYRPVTRQRLVVTAVSPNVTDPLGPGTSDFSFGADFSVDNLTEGRGLDDGNNLVQRGLSGDPAQYKLQIDRDRVSCLVAGDAGEVFVQTEQQIRPHVWYRASCSRTGPVVTLNLGTFDDPPEHAVEPGDTGALYVPAATPLVLGGKATTRGEAVVGDSDQFNGALDNVFLAIDEGS
jgi:hypothetical protein